MSPTPMLPSVNVVKNMPQYKHAAPKPDTRQRPDKHDSYTGASSGRRYYITQSEGLKYSDTIATRPQYIPPEEAFSDKPLQDHMLAANVSTSTLKVVQVQKNGISLGDIVQVNVILHDGYGKRKHTGGDSLRARMYETSLGADIAGYVTDNNNGEYLVTFAAYWAGTPSIEICLHYTREAIRIMYYARKPEVSAQGLLGVFSHGNATEETQCYPSQNGLEKYPHLYLCDLSGMNAGMPLYCIPPTNRRLRCEDWTDIRQVNLPFASTDVFTDGENLLLNKTSSKENKIGDTLTITVKAGPKGEAKMDESALPICYNYDRQKLWSAGYPVGYFYENQWHVRFCRLTITRGKYQNCLRGKRVMLLGDSTTRQWYKELQNKLERCNQTTDVWTHDNWHVFSSCTVADRNIVVEWIPHAHAFYHGNKHSANVKAMKSMPTYIDEVRPDEDVVVLIHLFSHALKYHHDIFRGRMERIRDSVERLLARNPNAIIAIKGPHTCINQYGLEDYYGYLYYDIMFDVFKSLHDRVIYLHHRDMTSGRYIANLHPTYYVVQAMIRQLLGYVCR